MPNWLIWLIASAGSTPCSERERHRSERAGLRVILRVQIPVEPAVLGALDAGRAALHVVLRVKVRSRFVMRSAGMDDGEFAPLEERHERRHARVESEESVEIQGALGSAGSWHGDRRPAAVVRPLAVGDDHVEAIDCAALKDGDHHLLPRARRRHRLGDELRREPEAQERKTSVLEKDTSVHGDSYRF
jgi:hypothetical protein